MTGASGSGQRRPAWPPRPLRLNQRTFAPDQLLVMAVVNEVRRDQAAAMERVRAALAEGADIVNIGAGPSRPGDEVEVREEIRQIIPFVAAVRDAYPDVVISVEVGRHEVGREACAAGADLLSDNRGGHEPGLAEVAAEFGAGLVCSHAGHVLPGTPDGTLAQVARAVDAGVDPARIVIAAGRDFGQDAWLSAGTGRRLAELVATGWPVMVSLSDRDFAGETIGAASGGRPTRSLSGRPTGSLSGRPTGPLSGRPTGPLSGRPTGPLSGRPTGSLDERPTGSLDERPTGSLDERPTGSLSGRPTGPLDERPTGSLSGRPTGSLSGRPTGPLDERLAGPLAAAAVFAWLGARIFRVRHVRETRRVLSMVAAIRGDIPPAYAVRGLA